MTPDELRVLLERGAGPHTEFKHAVNDNRELARQLVCFANSDGGRLVVGVDDGGRVTGVPDTDAALLRVDSVAFDGCTPPVTVVPEVVRIDGLDVVVLGVPRGDERPYGTRDGRYYVRSGARCRQAGRNELLRLFQSAESLYYDELPMRRLGLADLDLGAVARHIDDAGPADHDDEDVPRVLTAWRMLVDGHPTVGGLVVFGRAPAAPGGGAGRRRDARRWGSRRRLPRSQGSRRRCLRRPRTDRDLPGPPLAHAARDRRFRARETTRGATGGASRGGRQRPRTP